MFQVCASGHVADLITDRLGFRSLLVEPSELEASSISEKSEGVQRIQ
jgi:hypothetical protein